MKNIAICIGAQKAGTTWLFRCLQEHSDISTSVRKETHFFSKTYNKNRTTEYVKSFVKNDTKKILLDVSTSYLSHTECPERILKHFPTAKVIVILRDPSERTFSHYLHYKSRKWVEQQSLRDAIQQYPELIGNSLYGKHLSHYLSYIAKENFLVIDFNDIKKDPQMIIDTVCNFIDVPAITPKALKKKYHSTQARSNVMYFKIVKYHKYLTKNQTGLIIIRLLRLLGINNLLIDNLLRKTSKQKPALEQDDKQWLNEQFKEDQKILSEVLNGLM